MGFDQYHEPANELSPETRTFASMMASLTEEAEAIGWYEQRLAVEPNARARAIMANARGRNSSTLGRISNFFSAPEAKVARRFRGQAKQRAAQR
jgi:uncharacterized protein